MVPSPPKSDKHCNLLCFVICTVTLSVEIEFLKTLSSKGMYPCSSPSVFPLYRTFFNMMRDLRLFMNSSMTNMFTQTTILFYLFSDIENFTFLLAFPNSSNQAIKADMTSSRTLGFDLAPI